TAHSATRHVVSRRSRTRICRTRGTATSVGGPTVRSGNSMSYIHTSGKNSQCRVRRARSGPRSNSWVEQLDLATVIKVSQAVSGEIVLEKLIDTLRRTAVEQPGSERGLVLLPVGE